MFGEEYRPLSVDVKNEKGWHNPVWYSHDGRKAMIAVFPSPIPPWHYTLNEKVVRDHLEALRQKKIEAVTVAIVKPNGSRPDQIARLPLTEIFENVRHIQPRLGRHGNYWCLDERGKPTGNFFYNGVPF